MTRRLFVAGWVVLCLLLIAGREAYAQLPVGTVIAPTIVESDPSPDHNVIWTDGTPVVDHYEVYYFVFGTASPVTTVNLGKPAPQADGKIRAVDVFGGLLKDAIYFARVVAVGTDPAKRGESADSNPFVLPGPAPTPRPPTNVRLMQTPAQP